MLCPSTFSTKHSRTFSFFGFTGHRHHNSVVEGKARPENLCSASSLASLSSLKKDLRCFLRSWYTQALTHSVPCHPPSLKTIFVKHSAVVDILCNHKQAIEEWGNNTTPTCVCGDWKPYQSASYDSTAEHWVLQGHSLGQHLSADLQVLAEGSLQNKVFHRNGTSLRLCEKV